MYFWKKGYSYISCRFTELDSFHMIRTKIRFSQTGIITQNLESLINSMILRVHDKNVLSYWTDWRVLSPCTTVMENWKPCTLWILAVFRYSCNKWRERERERQRDRETERKIWCSRSWWFLMKQPNLILNAGYINVHLCNYESMLIMTYGRLKWSPFIKPMGQLQEIRMVGSSLPPPLPSGIESIKKNNFLVWGIPTWFPLTKNGCSLSEKDFTINIV